jgi:hypothetical protein
VLGFREKCSSFKFVSARHLILLSGESASFWQNNQDFESNVMAGIHVLSTNIAKSQLKFITHAFYIVFWYSEPPVS